MNITNTDNTSTVPVVCVVMGKQKQWVKVANSGAKYDQTITWPLAFTNTNYAFVLAPTPDFENVITSGVWRITAKNTNNFIVRLLEQGGLYAIACGN